MSFFFYLEQLGKDKTQDKEFYQPTQQTQICFVISLLFLTGLTSIPWRKVNLDYYHQELQARNKLIHKWGLGGGGEGLSEIETTMNEMDRLQ